MRQLSLQEMGLVNCHDTKADGSWCGAFNPTKKWDALGRPILATMCSHCGEPIPSATRSVPAASEAPDHGR